MSNEQPNNPLHGLSLEKIVTRLVEHFGWNGLYERVRVNCFKKDPSIKSSLKFLRKTQWARDKVEVLYIETFC
ncbi:TPA: VF530 family protein [Vibrio diabolicus]|uniref:VF530 family protein n=1 Tax=Vibrio diabolicus TaxID=50719 RepID=UPI002150BF47|nr:VF530 family protein [Vibrio diabolicus]MDF4689324.1 VF530 family protein [Vibrio parahaemolyticus]UDY84713.1 VF530 family protein [Vibrio diabolicus]